MKKIKIWEKKFKLTNFFIINFDYIMLSSNLVDIWKKTKLKQNFITK